MNNTGAATPGHSDDETIEVRDVRFDLSDVPADWHGGGRSIGVFFDNLSIFFPLGERYFVSSVKAFRSHANTPQLKADVDGFCAQEGHHSREHVRYNQWLETLGYPVASMEKGVAWSIALARKRLSPMRQLGSTCALEHFTALLGQILLSDPRGLEGAHPKMAALWKWHAVEENEHKAVAFDLFKAAGGSYLQRVTTMVSATILFWLRVTIQQVRMMAAAKILFSLPEWWKLFRFLWLKPGGIRRLVIPYFGYFRPSFHPNVHNTVELSRAWRAEFATLDVYRQAVRS